jgi:hypothetical protein
MDRRNVKSHPPAPLAVFGTAAQPKKKLKVKDSESRRGLSQLLKRMSRIGAWYRWAFGHYASNDPTNSQKVRIETISVHKLESAHLAAKRKPTARASAEE